MDDMLFHTPVAIAVGAGFKREITSLAEMQNFLREWPPAKRGRSTARPSRPAMRRAPAPHRRPGEAGVLELRRGGRHNLGRIDPVTALPSQDRPPMRARTSRHGPAG
jgi:hypothetical protein